MRVQRKEPTRSLGAYLDLEEELDDSEEELEEEDEALDPEDDEEESPFSAFSSTRYLDRRGQSDRSKMYVKMVPVTASPITTADVTPCISILKANV